MPTPNYLLKTSKNSVLAEGVQGVELHMLM